LCPFEAESLVKEQIRTNFLCALTESSTVASLVQGFVGGLVAGLVGYVTDIATGTIFEAFKVLNPLIPLLGFVFAVISFFAGIQEAYVTGVFFSLGIVAAGFLFRDFVTIVAGFISIAGLVLSFFKK